jgi:hypothetical protein
MMTLPLLKTLTVPAIACIQACRCIFIAVKNIFNHKANDAKQSDASFFIYRVNTQQAIDNGQWSIAGLRTIDCRLLTVDSRLTTHHSRLSFHPLTFES